jgi:hypothetical protein
LALLLGVSYAAHSIFGPAQPVELAGDPAAATDGYREFLELMGSSDGAHPEVAASKN